MSLILSHNNSLFFSIIECEQYNDRSFSGDLGIRTFIILPTVGPIGKQEISDPHSSPFTLFELCIQIKCYSSNARDPFIEKTEPPNSHI